MLYGTIYIKCPEEANLHRQKENQSLQVAVGGKWGMTDNGYRASIYIDENVLKLDYGNYCTIQ